MKRDYLTLKDYTRDEINYLIELAISYKKDPKKYRGRLSDYVIGMIFEKPSTRTRVSLETAAARLGAHAIYLDSKGTQLGRGETIEDTARVLSRYVDLITARVYSHESLESLAKNASVPVINALSDLYHPAQALADYMSILEHFGRLEGLTLTYVGDAANNMASSLIIGGAILGVKVKIGAPEGYWPSKDVLEFAENKGMKIEVSSDPFEAVKGAHVVYTDVWVSMGDEAEKERRLKALAPYQVNLRLFESAQDNAVFMHCLPAHRGQEVTDEVADHPRSIIFDQAENRLHTAAALFLYLLGKDK